MNILKSRWPATPIWKEPETAYSVGCVPIAPAATTKRSGHFRSILKQLNGLNLASEIDHEPRTELQFHTFVRCCPLHSATIVPICSKANGCRRSGQMSQFSHSANCLFACVLEAAQGYPFPYRFAN